MSSESLGCPFHPEGQLMEDKRSGDPICRECDLTVGRKSTEGSECRTISSERATGNVSSLARAENPLLLGSDLSTTLAQDSESSKLGKEGSKRRRKNPLEQTLTKTLITTTAERLDLPKNVVKKAEKLLKKVYGKPKLSRKNNVATACLYIASRQMDTIRTFKEVCYAAQKSEKEVGRCFNRIIKILDIRLEIVTAEDFVPGFCEKLELPLAVNTAAIEIANRAGGWNLVHGRAPISIAGGAIYMASQASTTKKTHRQIAEAGGMGYTTVRKVYQLMRPKAAELFPEDFKFDTPTVELPWY